MQNCLFVRAASLIVATAVCALSGPSYAQQLTGNAPPAPSVAPGLKLRMVDMWLNENTSRPRPAGAKVDVIMLHFSSDVVTNPENPYDPARIAQIFNNGKVSAHYLIGRDGVVYKFVPEER